MATPDGSSSDNIDNLQSFTLLEFEGIAAYFPLPKEVSFETRYDWAAAEMGALGFLMEAMKNVEAGDYSAMNKSIFHDMANATSMVASQHLIPEAGLVSLEAAVNPKETLMFRGTKQREFSLSFSLASKSAARMKGYITMLNALYVAAAPTFKSGDVFIQYPKKGKLSIVDNGADIINPRDCAIQRINTNLNPDGNFATYTNGVPVHIVVTMDFIEVNLPSKDLDKKVLGGG